MGHLFSRAIKRFTQCSSRNQLPSQEQQETSQQQQAQQQRERDSIPIAQAISVGQSIDSAEYATFETDRSTKKGKTAESTAGEGTKKVPPPRIDEDKNEDIEDKENELAQQQLLENVSNQDEAEQGAQNKPQVEEAVIKIQALVRGHLTRKALKDAQQQAATPLHNALGQSQFDEESLTKNPPSAVFLPSSPLNITTNNDLFNDQNNKFGNNSLATARVPPLESIAEDVETAATTNDSHQSATNRGSRRKLSPNNCSLAISLESRSDSISPAASEANASIDLNCDTPASASIDILDHNIRATDALASVLYIKEAQTADKPSSSVTVPDQPSEVDSPRMLVESPPSTVQLADTNLSTSLSPVRPSNMATITNSHSIDSAEAAAIRIQSAFRGYHTRKHSPYRRRSPGNTSTSPPARRDTNNCSNNNNGNCGPIRNELRQQNATAADNLDDSSLELSNGIEMNDDDRLTQVQDTGRRLSRQRQRLGQTDDELDQIMKDLALSSVDEFTTTTEDQSTVRETPQKPTTASNSEEQSSNTQQTRSDGASNTTCITMLASESKTGANISIEPQNLTQGECSLEIHRQQPAGDDANLSIDRNVSVEMDTDSSNLGAALSLNEDISFGSDAQASEQMHHEQSSSKQVTSLGEDKSDGASLINDKLASEARKLVDQLINDDDDGVDDEKDALETQQESALEKATDELEAALEEATEDDDNDKVAENLANAILDEEEQRMIELESDDIERRDPSGRVSEDRVKSPPIRTSDQQPALVSGESLDDEGQVCDATLEQSGGPQNQRLGIETPDEAIGSGRSSPALISSNGGSGSSDEDDADEADVKETAGQSGEKQVATQDEGNKQQGGKSKRKNRKRKGRK